MFWSAYAPTRTLLWFGHGCFGQRMLLEHERYYGLGMDALVSVCSRNTNIIMVCAWMLWSAYALGKRTLLWFGHGCFGQRMLSEHERYYGLGMDALVSACSRNTKTLKSAKPGELMRHARSTANTSKFSASRQKYAKNPRQKLARIFSRFPGFRDLAQLCSMPPCQLSYPGSFAS